MSSTSVRLIAAVAAAVLAPATVAAQGAGLFAPADQAVPQSGSPAGSPAEVTLRSRTATIDLGQVQRARGVAAARQAARFAGASGPTADGGGFAPAAGAALTLNLFDDTVFTGLVEWTDPTFSGGYSVSGALVGEPLGTMTLVVNGERVVGTVRSLGGTYHIRTVGPGLLAISEVEEPPFRCGVLEPHAETPTHRH